MDFTQEFPWLEKIVGAIIPLHYFERTEEELREFLEMLELEEQQYELIQNWWWNLDGGAAFLREDFRDNLSQGLRGSAPADLVQELLSEMDSDDERWFVRDAFDFHPSRWADTQPATTSEWFFEAVITSTGVGELLEELEDALKDWFLSEHSVQLFRILGERTRTLANQL